MVKVPTDVEARIVVFTKIPTLIASIGGGGGPWAPRFYGTPFARKDQNILIEQSGMDTLIEQSQHSEKQCSKLLSYVCVVINKEILAWPPHSLACSTALVASSP